MSSKSTRRRNKEIRNKNGSITLEELENTGQVPKNFHLFDSIDMKEYQKQFQTDWWKRMGSANPLIQ